MGKLELDKLKVQSFVTTLSDRKNSTIKGGGDTVDYGCTSPEQCRTTPDFCNTNDCGGDTTDCPPHPTGNYEDCYE